MAPKSVVRRGDGGDGDRRRRQDGKPNGGRVLVDFAIVAQACADLASTPITLSLELSRTPCGPLKMGFPDEETVRAFEDSAGLTAPPV